MVRRTCFLPAVVCLFIAASAPAADEVQVPSVLVKLLEEVEVPAREDGVLESVSAHEGEMVEAGAALAQIDDAEARFDARRAQTEMFAAEKQAESDVKVRFARKSAEVAEAELRRAVDSRRRFAQSVSDSEMDKLRLTQQKSELEIEQAQLELELAQAVRAAKLVDVQSAEHSVQQRRVVAPLAGFVAEVNRHQGEWVKPGETILRIVRLDRLRAEGLVDASAVDGRLKGRKTELTVQIDGQPVTFAGTVTYVSPEIDPVNGQIRIWAEIENPQLKLRPGLHGSMTIAGAAPQ